MRSVLTALLFCSIFLAALPAAASIPIPSQPDQPDGLFAPESVTGQAYAKAPAAMAVPVPQAPSAPPAPQVALDGLGLNPAFILSAQPEAELASWLASLDPDRPAAPDRLAVPVRPTAPAGENPQPGPHDLFSEDTAGHRGPFACVFWEPTLKLVSPDASWLEDCEIISGFALRLAETWLAATVESLVAQADFDPFPQPAINGSTRPALAPPLFPAVFGAGTAETVCTTITAGIDFARPIQAARLPSPFDPVTPTAAGQTLNLAKAWPALRMALNPGAALTAAADLANLPWPDQAAQLALATLAQAPNGSALPPAANSPLILAKTRPILAGFDPPADDAGAALTSAASPTNLPWPAQAAQVTHEALSPGDGALLASLGLWAETGVLRPRNGEPATRDFVPPNPELNPALSPAAGRKAIGLLIGPLSRRVILTAVPLWRSRDSPRLAPKIKARSLVLRLSHDVRLGILDCCLGPSP